VWISASFDGGVAGGFGRGGGPGGGPGGCQKRKKPRAGVTKGFLRRNFQKQLSEIGSLSLR